MQIDAIQMDGYPQASAETNMLLRTLFELKAIETTARLTVTLYSRMVYAGMLTWPDGREVLIAPTQQLDNFIECVLANVRHKADTRDKDDMKYMEESAPSVSIYPQGRHTGERVVPAVTNYPQEWKIEQPRNIESQVKHPHKTHLIAQPGSIIYEADNGDIQTTPLQIGGNVHPDVIALLQTLFLLRPIEKAARLTMWLDERLGFAGMLIWPDGKTITVLPAKRLDCFASNICASLAEHTTPEND